MCVTPSTKMYKFFKIKCTFLNLVVICVLSCCFPPYFVPLHIFIFHVRRSFSYTSLSSSLIIIIIVIIILISCSIKFIEFACFGLQMVYVAIAQYPKHPGLPRSSPNIIKSSITNS